MRPLVLSCLLALLTLATVPLTRATGEEPAGPPPILVKMPNTAVKTAADAGVPLILFALIDNSGATQKFAKLLNDNHFKLNRDEFIVALCDDSQRMRAGFANAFKQEITGAPFVVITDPTYGPQAPALQGMQNYDDYDRMIHAALVAAGLRDANTPVVSSTTGEVIEGSSKVFQLKKSDVMAGPVVITDYRNWTFKTGASFHGAVLKAEGATGTFVLDDGEEKVVNFNDLSPEDIQYLQSKLGGG